MTGLYFSETSKEEAILIHKAASIEDAKSWVGSFLAYEKYGKLEIGVNCWLYLISDKAVIGSQQLA